MLTGIITHRKFLLSLENIASIKIITKENIGDTPKTVKRDRKDTSKMEVKSNAKKIAVPNIRVKIINHLRE